jgi:hypothetical protein
VAREHHTGPDLALGTEHDVFRAASDGNGGAFVAWADNRSGVLPANPFYYDLYGQHILGTGTLDPAWGANGLPVCIAPQAQYDLAMAPDGFGGTSIVWEDDRDSFFQILASSSRAASYESARPGSLTSLGPGSVGVRPK